MFDPRKQPPNILDPVTTLTHNWEPLNFDFQVSQKHGNQFRAQKMEDHDDESGGSSPPLWKNSPPTSPVHPIINYRLLSPSSRAQAIARGQWELMEMVKNMPESCFELSLKDLVEQPKSFESQEECLINNSREKKHVVQNIRKNDQIGKAKMMRRKSTIENGGLFIKMVSPVSLRSNKKKKKKNSSANTTRVSPKPEEEFENSSSKTLEKDWWKKRFSGSSSGSSSSNSGSTGRNRSRGSSSSSSTSSRNNSTRKRNGILSSCWSSLCFSNISISAGCS